MGLLLALMATRKFPISRSLIKGVIQDFNLEWDCLLQRERLILLRGNTASFNRSIIPYKEEMQAFLKEEGLVEGKMREVREAEKPYPRMRE